MELYLNRPIQLMMCTGSNSTTPDEFRGPGPWLSIETLFSRASDAWMQSMVVLPITPVK